MYRQAVLRKSLDFKKTILISELIRDLSQGWSPKCLSESIENDDKSNPAYPFAIHRAKHQ